MPEKSLVRAARTYLRPAKLRSALKRRWFEHRMSRVRMRHLSGLIELGTAYGSWIMPGDVIDSSWNCYLAGAGGDVSLDLELVRRYGVTTRSFDPVLDYVERAVREGRDEPRFSAHHAAIAVADGPVRMQITHDAESQSVSGARLYDSHSFVEVPGRSLRSLMAELGDERIDLLKLDIEGSEYQLLPSLDLDGLGVKVLAVQLHHNGSVKAARRLMSALDEQGYDLVACCPVIKLTFLRRGVGPTNRQRLNAGAFVGPTDFDSQ
jgi:FkbM family methyltransferase